MRDITVPNRNGERRRGGAEVVRAAGLRDQTGGQLQQRRGLLGEWESTVSHLPEPVSIS